MARDPAERDAGLSFALDCVAPESGNEFPPDMKEGPDAMSGPSQDSSQGDNPNIALTRPHNIGPLTLFGQ